MTSYRYCFYDSRTGNDDNDNDDDDESSSSSSSSSTYGAKLMIYRRSSPSSATYTPVPGSIRTLSLLRSTVGRFRCNDENLPQHFEIQENDVVGACVMDTESVNPLYLIGDTNDNSANYSLYQLDRSGFDDCTNTQIGSVNTGHRNFRRRRDFKLHLYANISKQ